MTNGGNGRAERLQIMLSAEELTVLPKLDSHPNPIAHEIAANEILNFIEDQDLMK